jgi:hypothetical protein
MIDSENLNEKVGQVANTPYEENVDQSQDKPTATETQPDTEVVKGTVMVIDNNEVNIELEDGNVAILPLNHFNKGEVSVGDGVELRLQEKNGKKTVLNIVSHVKAQQSAETEHPQDDKPEDGDIQAKVTKVEKKDDKTIITLETLGDKKIMITDSNEIRLM